MQRDDLSVAYADSFPATLQGFLADVERGARLLLLGFCQGRVAGAAWLHDLLRETPGHGRAGWVGLYVLPAYRGQTAVRFWPLGRAHWEAQGVRHFFTASHVRNRASQCFIRRMLRFHRVGIYPAFTMLAGRPADFVVYCSRHEDQALAWQAAQMRAGALPHLQAVAHQGSSTTHAATAP